MKTYNDLIFEHAKAFNGETQTLRAFLFELCNEKNINLYALKDKEADEEIIKKYEEGVKRLLNDEPLNYVLGYSYFYGYKLKVDKAVLIPRFETEELVGRVLSTYDEVFSGKEVTVADVGTGSGAIAIALKKEEAKMTLIASDISKQALEVARFNAEENGADIKFIEGSMLEPYINLGIKVDILVSNPPYIKQDEVLENSVKDYEPHVALFGGEDGLKYYREIFENANKILKPHGILLFEIGYDQKENLEKLASSYFDSADIKVYKDINNKDRMLVIKL